MSTGVGSNRHQGQKVTIHLTPCEFEIMEVLWQLGSATVRDVYTALQPTRGLAYTTVMTVMEKLHRKGALEQQRHGRAYRYTVRISQAEALHQRIEHLIKHYFQGSAEKFLEYLRQEFDQSVAATRPPQVTPAAEAGAAEPPDADMDTALL